MMNLTIVLLTAVLLQVGAPSSTQTPTSELSGRVVDRDTGVPIPRAVVHLHKFPEGDEVAAQTDQDGRWGFTELTPGEYVGFADAGPFRETHLREPMLFSDKERNLVPGNYALRATVGGSNGFVQRQPTEVGFAGVRVDAADIDDLIITMAKPVDVAGRIVLEDPAASFTVAPGSGVPFLSARLASDKGPGYGSTSTAYPDEKRSFKFEGIFGRRTIDIANVPRGWYVKSIKYRGKEVIDTPTEFGPSDDPAGLEVLMSNRGGIVSGKVTDDAGKPVRGARVMLLSVNQDRWTMFASYAGTRATSAADGTYRFGPQRDGDYFVVAVASADMEPIGDDREQLTRITERAERITLTLGEERSLDLRVIKPE